MPKNLILIPLESISNTILWQYRVELATVWQLMMQSFVYNRFYGSSTSTESILMEFYNGCSDTFDGLSLYSERNDTKHPWIANNRRPSKLWSVLTTAGYSFYFATEDFLSPPVSTPAWMQSHSVDNMLAAAKQRLMKAKSDKKPLMLMFRIVISHMAFDDNVKIRASTFSERFRLGYMQLDRAINRLLSLIMDLGMLEDSVIVCFGDHGDELWSHGLNKGYCHALPPYASLNWIPLFIYESGRPPGSSDALISTIDLRESLVKMLVPEYDLNKYKMLVPFRRTRFDGIDAFHERRELAFSQNLFALQLEYTDLEKGLSKGYSVTDGTYRLVVSSGGTDPRNGGLEFFCDPVDPANTRNLLDFFSLDSNGDVRKFSPPAEVSDREFSLAFNARAVAHLTETYHKLKKALHEYVREKEGHALKFNPGPNHTMPESVFRHARKRLLED